MNSSKRRHVEAFVTLFDPFVTVQVKSAGYSLIIPLGAFMPFNWRLISVFLTTGN